MMRRLSFGGAKNESPSLSTKQSSIDAKAAKCIANDSRSAHPAEEKEVLHLRARCSDLEQEIIRLKLEVAEAKTNNAWIVKENRTLKEEVSDLQSKNGMQLIEISQLRMNSSKCKHDLDKSVQREGSWKKRVHDLNEEVAQLRHHTCSSEGLSNSSRSLLSSHGSASSLVRSVSARLMGGRGSDNSLSQIHRGNNNRLTKSNSYGLRRATSTNATDKRVDPVHPFSNQTAMRNASWGNAAYQTKRHRNASLGAMPNAA